MPDFGISFGLHLDYGSFVLDSAAIPNLQLKNVWTTIRRKMIIARLLGSRGNVMPMDVNSPAGDAMRIEEP